MPLRCNPRTPAVLCLATGILSCGDDQVTSPPPDPTGTLAVTTTSIGSGIDADGYRVVLNGDDAGEIGASDSVAARIALGQHEVELTGLADNCGVMGENPTAVTVVQDEETVVDFSVACPPFFDYIAFTWDDIYVMEVEGSIPVSVTAHLDHDDAAYLDWSPDGTRLAYRVSGDDGYDIQILRLDGSEPITIALPSYFCVHDLDWTPDLDWIGFTGGDLNHDVWLVRADGSNLTNLTNSAAEEWSATWSPDGGRILYTAYQEESGLYIMEADGSGTALLQAPIRSGDLHWSPDGSQVAYTGKCEVEAVFQQICVMDPDGSNSVALTDPPDHDGSPDWSPDGSRIAFFSGRDGGGIFVMNADGSDVSFLVEGGQPAWSPGQ